MQVMPHGEKICKSCKWRHLVAMRNQWMKFSGVRRASVKEAPSLSYSCPPPTWLPEVHPWRCRPQRWHQEWLTSHRWLRQRMIYCWNWEIWDWIKVEEYSVFTQNTVTTEWWNISLMKKGVDGQIERCILNKNMYILKQIKRLKFHLSTTMNFPEIETPGFSNRQKSQYVTKW